MSKKIIESDQLNSTHSVNLEFFLFPNIVVFFFIFYILRLSFSLDSNKNKRIVAIKGLQNKKEYWK
jgi:hypothetical protein